MNQNHTLHYFLNGLLLSALAICSASLAQNRPVTQYFYDANGNLTSTVDGLNRVTTQTYDTLDRLRRITQPPPAAMQPNPVIQLELNGRDDLTRVIDPRNLATDYAVSGLSTVTSQTSPDTGVTTRTFDAAGNALTSKDARNRTTTYTYDVLHRLTKAAYGDGSSSTYVYDQGANGVGRLTSMTDPGPITTSWTYTAMGQSPPRPRPSAAVLPPEPISSPTTTTPPPGNRVGHLSERQARQLHLRRHQQRPRAHRHQRRQCRERHHLSPVRRRQAHDAWQRPGME